MTTESEDQRNLDSDDHFIAVDHKVEAENDPEILEDQFENNGPGWASQVLGNRLLTVKKKFLTDQFYCHLRQDGEDEWSTSDAGMISIVPNSESAPPATVQINFGNCNT